jgi:hypothetical protein
MGEKSRATMRFLLRSGFGDTRKKGRGREGRAAQLSTGMTDGGCGRACRISRAGSSYIIII